MSDVDEYRCFIGGLAWSTSDRKLKDAFEKFGKLTEAKVSYFMLDYKLVYPACTFGLDLKFILLFFSFWKENCSIYIHTEHVY